jgi:hypothetical protein
VFGDLLWGDAVPGFLVQLNALVIPGEEPIPLGPVLKTQSRKTLAEYKKSIELISNYRNLR